MKTLLNFSPEVKDALANNKPVLALESTLLTHGSPYPHNIEIARAAEEIARSYGVTPATIAIVKGEIKIGITDQELEILVQDKNSVKASRRDIPFVMSHKLNAGTTVAATLFFAHAAGIKVFATGGIGGVHRGESQDISADLIEMTKTPLALVCAGAKAILDIPKTLEFLETFSVPIIGYGTQSMPAFYSADSTHKLHFSANNIESLKEFVKMHWQLGLTSSVLIANPIPKAHEIPANEIEIAIAKALSQAQKSQIKGKEITPFLLNEIREITQGRSLQANISLIKNNVKLGAELAKAIA